MNLVYLLLALRLHLRNKMALIYSYLFPTIFLVAFYVLYRFEQVPLVRHMGELLTVTALGGACFGLPTTMVGERERGVWRRYRLAPVGGGTLVAGTVAARYLLLLVAALLQVVLAMAIGMPLPRHPFDLFIAFTCVAFAFIGLGLIIAMMADNVPAVQALGQCIFLPMLIIGGVAVPLAALPDWAQRVSSYFPGRYAVEAIQATVTGDGLGAVAFSIGALLVIGAAGCLAGAMMFRWDAQQRFVSTRGKGWVAVAIASWVAVGAAAESRGIRPQRSTTAASTSQAPAVPPSVAPPPVTAPPSDSRPAVPEPAPSTPPVATTSPTAPPAPTSPPAVPPATKTSPPPTTAPAPEPAAPYQPLPTAPPAAGDTSPKPSEPHHSQGQSANMARRDDGRHRSRSDLHAPAAR